MTTDERSEPGHDSLSDATQSKKVSTKWRGYLDATLGFRNHWNPVGYGHEIAEGAFVAVTALDEPILLTRVDGEVRAIQDRCAHRGARFSAQPLCFRKGTVSCWYHGWTYDLADGRLSDVLTSPGSPVIGRVRVPTYPVVEAQGLVFVYVGDGDPPALAHDVPPGFLDEDTHCLGIRRTVRSNWRIGVENGFDTTHIFMHRNSALIKGNNIALPLGFVPTDRGAVQVHGEGWPKGVVDNLSENYVPVFEASLQGVPVWTSELRGDEKRVAGQISVWLPGVLKVDPFPDPSLIQYEFYSPSRPRSTSTSRSSNVRSPPSRTSRPSRRSSTRPGGISVSTASTTTTCGPARSWRSSTGTVTGGRTSASSLRTCASSNGGVSRPRTDVAPSLRSAHGADRRERCS